MSTLAKSESGFSLPQLLISIGLLGLILVCILGMKKLSTKGSVTTKETEMISTTNLIKLRILDDLHNIVHMNGFSQQPPNPLNTSEALYSVKMNAAAGDSGFDNFQIITGIFADIDLPIVIDETNALIIYSSNQPANSSFSTLFIQKRNQYVQKIFANKRYFFVSSINNNAIVTNLLKASISQANLSLCPANSICLQFEKATNYLSSDFSGQSVLRAAEKVTLAVRHGNLCRIVDEVSLGTTCQPSEILASNVSAFQVSLHPNPSLPNDVDSIQVRLNVDSGISEDSAVISSANADWEVLNGHLIYKTIFTSNTAMSGL